MKEKDFKSTIRVSCQNFLLSYRSIKNFSAILTFHELSFHHIYGNITSRTILNIKESLVKLVWIVFFSLSLQVARAEFLPQSFSAKFEQEYISILKGNVKKGQGSIDYKYPSNIRFETSTPSQIIFVSNGIKSWYYRAPFIEGEDGEVSESPARDGSSVYIKFFDSLKNGLSANLLYDVKSAGDGMHVITFKAKTAKEFGIKEAILTFNSAKDKDFSELKKIDLLFPDGKKSTLRFMDLKVNPSFDAQKFNFVAPPKTKKTN
jgi:outer membrane lipoprotein-sorting protein